jgi:hypothetical protein
MDDYLIDDENSLIYNVIQPQRYFIHEGNVLFIKNKNQKGY